MSKSTQEITKLEGDELVVKSKVMEGEIVSKPSRTCITTLINTEKGKELVVKVANMDGGGGGGGTGEYVPSITTTQFVMDPNNVIPIPVVDDLKDIGEYSIILDLSSLSPDMGMTYSLVILNQGILVQIISVAGTGISFRRIFENNAWTEWENITDLMIQNSLDEVEGYDNTKNQVLKNSTGNLQWSEESGGGTVDQTYDPTSTNAQSGTAVAEAVAPALKNKATGTGSLQISTTSTTAIPQTYVTAIGNVVATGSSGIGISSGNTSCTVSTASIAIGNALAAGVGSIAISPNNYGGATAADAIQLGGGSNSTAKTLQVFQYQLLNGNTGLIPADRLGTGFDATKTQVLKNVNGTLTWVDEA